ncbi:MAG: hypothetical protein L7S67_00170 [Flavobacteriales bacterium]|nr:hypothetical protein [Flavobacteriales bacterium]
MYGNPPFRGLPTGGGGTTVTGGDGLVLTGTTLDVVTADASRIVVNANDIDLATAGTAGTYSQVTTDAYGRVISGTTGTEVVGGDGLLLTGNTLDVGTADVSRIVVNANDIDLATAGTAGTYNQVTTDAYGRVMMGTTTAGGVSGGDGLVLTGSTLDVVTADASRIVVNADDIDLATAGTAGTYSQVTTDAYGRVISGTTGTEVVGGDGLLLTGNTLDVVTADASRIVVNANDIDLATAGTAGTYTQVTTDAYGRVISGTTVASLTCITDETEIPIVGSFRRLNDNTEYVICGSVTFTYPIEYGINTSLRGLDFSSTITFDETSRDCYFRSVDQNVYLSNITVINGGGRFSGTQFPGFFDCTNVNVGAGPPFYGRNRRFKITDVNIIRAFSLGKVQGFGTLNFTNNFVNGGGGLAGQPTSYYTNHGIQISDGLSLEFNNNKMVLMLGAQQASTLKQIDMTAAVVGFNAVTVTGNIIHPRNSETGIDFDSLSRTELGNISGNVFIRTGGTSPLINYPDQTTFNNYNPLCISNYIVSANTGVTNADGNLKASFTTSTSVTGTLGGTLAELFFSDNSVLLPVNLSTKFGVELALTGVTAAFVVDEIITDTASTESARIIGADALVGNTQTVYIVDMTGSFDMTPTTFTGSVAGSATGGTLNLRFKYFQPEPRKLTLIANFVVTVGNNRTYGIAPAINGVQDLQCLSEGFRDNNGAGASLTLSCALPFEENDIINFFFGTDAMMAAGNIEKGNIFIS